MFQVHRKVSRFECSVQRYVKWLENVYPKDKNSNVLVVVQSCSIQFCLSSYAFRHYFKSIYLSYVLLYHNLTNLYRCWWHRRKRSWTNSEAKKYFRWIKFRFCQSKGINANLCQGCHVWQIVKELNIKHWINFADCTWCNLLRRKYFGRWNFPGKFRFEPSEEFNM